MPNIAFTRAVRAHAIAPLLPVGPDLGLEARCLALNIYHEARSEPTIGQVAVAMVTLNRVADDAFPNTVCSVVKQGGYKRGSCQFSWYCDGKTDLPRNTKAWRRAQEVAYMVLFHGAADPTRGAMWYHTKYVKPRWARRLRRTKSIGVHVYYANG